MSSCPSSKTVFFIGEDITTEVSILAVSHENILLSFSQYGPKHGDAISMLHRLKTLYYLSHSGSKTEVMRLGYIVNVEPVRFADGLNTSMKRPRQSTTSQPGCPPHPRDLSEASAVMSQSIPLGSGQPLVITPGTRHYSEGHRGTSGVTQCVPVLSPRNLATQSALGFCSRRPGCSQ